MFPKIQSFFGILKLALCAVPLGKFLTVGRSVGGSIPPGSISVKLWEFVRSLCAALFRSWDFQLAAIDICGSFGEAGSSCRTKSAEPCIIGAAIFAGGLPGSTGRTVKILTQQTFVSTAVTAQGVKALRFQRQQTFVSTAVTAQGVKALTFQRPTFKKG